MIEPNDIQDDWRLTAYALGELEGRERADVEARLARDEGARREVEAIRSAASALAAQIQEAGSPVLTGEQRAAVIARAQREAPVFRLRRSHWITAAVSMAAGAAIVAATPWFRGKRAEDGVEVAFTRSENLFDASHSTASTAPGDVGGARQDEAKGTLQGGAAAGYPNSTLVSASAGGRGGLGGTSASGDHYSHGGGGGGGGARTPGTHKTLQPSARHWYGAGGGAGGNNALTPFVGASGGGAGAPAGPPRAGDADKKSVGAAPAAREFEVTESLQTLGYIGGLADLGTSSAAYAAIEDNPFRLVTDAPLSTFGIDVDTASYANVRRFLNSGQLPPPGAVRIEELVNYFPYDYAPPADGRPFAVRVDVAGCPWKTDHRLVRVGLKGKVVASQARPAANLVFLLDVSGSMQPANRLPLVLQSMRLLVEKLEPHDRVAIVVYAGESGLALPSTSCEEKGKILAALDALHAGGSTNGAAGIQLAYDIAQQNRIEGGVNRVILATDGDFNVGVSDESSLVKLIEGKRASGTFLSVLGVGDDNFKDAAMERLSGRGNGNYAYIDTIAEGKKALVEQAQGTLVTIAKDAKIQVEFNPAQVGAYRLIGYEDRVLAAEDFKDDKKDAGDLGAGHTVTALYEIVPPSALTQTAGVEPLKYQTPPRTTGELSGELLTVKLRWKEPGSDVSTPMEVAVTDSGATYSSASADFKFAAAVAAFGMCLRDSPNKGQANLDAVIELATEGAANDPGGYRQEFLGLVKKAKALGAK